MKKNKFLTAIIIFMSEHCQSGGSKLPKIAILALGILKCKISQTIFRFCENAKIPAYVQVSGSKVIGHLIDSLVTSA